MSLNSILSRKNNKSIPNTKTKTKKFKYDRRCKDKNLKHLLNYKDGSWNKSKGLVGNYYKNYIFERKINLPNFDETIKDSFTQSIFENKDEPKLKNISIGDTIQIWKIYNKQKKYVHATCVIWADAGPLSFSFVNDDNSNNLIIESPSNILEVSLVRQKRHNPNLLEYKPRLCELLAIGKLNSEMIGNIQQFLLQTHYTVTRHVSIIKGFVPQQNDPYKINTQNNIQKRLLMNRLNKEFIDYEPIILRFDFYRGVIEDKLYCHFNSSRRSIKKNCMGSLDTIFKELFTCRLYGTYIIPSKCRAKKECFIKN
jgi:hypothetical protein